MPKSCNYSTGIDKLTSSVTGMWVFRACFDLKLTSQWALASIYWALRPLSCSASPCLEVNLSIPLDLIQFAENGSYDQDDGLAGKEALRIERNIIGQIIIVISCKYSIRNASRVRKPSYKCAELCKDWIYI